MKTLLTIAFVAACIGLVSSVALFISLLMQRKRIPGIKFTPKK